MHCRKARRYHLADSVPGIADGVIMGTAAVVIVAAGSILERATSPSEAVFAILVDAAACGALGAAVVVITDSGRFYRGRRRRARVGRIGPILYWVRSFHCDTAFASIGLDAPFHPNVPILSPFVTP